MDFEAADFLGGWRIVPVHCDQPYVDHSEFDEILRPCDGLKPLVMPDLLQSWPGVSRLVLLFDNSVVVIGILKEC